MRRGPNKRKTTKKDKPSSVTSFRKCVWDKILLKKIYKRAQRVKS
jgi:hypothetical protein